MKNIVGLILAVFLLMACSNSGGVGPTTEDPTTPPTPVDLPSPDPVEAANNPVVYFPSILGATNLSRSVDIPNTEWTTEFWAGAGPVIITNWSSTSILEDGDSFSKYLYGQEIVFTVNIEQDYVEYVGDVQDGGGYINIKYYNESATFDVNYRIIFEIVGGGPAGGNFWLAYMGKMEGAEVIDDSYTGEYQIYTFNNNDYVTSGTRWAQYQSAKSNIVVSPTLISSTCYDWYSTLVLGPSPAMQYISSFWDDIITMTNANYAEGWDIEVPDDFNFSKAITVVVEPPIVEEPTEEEPE